MLNLSTLRTILTLPLVVIAACSGEIVQQDGPPPLYKYASMKTAVTEGKGTLPVFWQAFNGGDIGQSEFALLVVTPSERQTEEYVWVEAITQLESGYRGLVPQEHEMKDGFKPGDAIDFAASDIADWRFKENGKYRGAYTTRAMMGLAPNANIDNIRALFHENPVP